MRQASVELVRTLLPAAKGIRLLGVTVSNFQDSLTHAEDELPLFADEAATGVPARDRSRPADGR